MQRPTTIRIMLVLTYLKLALTLMAVPQLLNLKVPEDVTASQLQVVIFKVSIEFVIGILLVVFIRKHKYLFALLCALALFIYPSLPMQFYLAVVLVLLFFLRSTRLYFKNKPSAISDKDEPIEVSATVDEATDAGADDSDSAEDGETSRKPAAIDKPKARVKAELDVTIRPANPEDANTIHTLMMLAFEEYRQTVPPSSALEETSEGILNELRSGNESAAILYEDDVAVAVVRYKFEGDAITFFRLSVIPTKRRRGYAKKLVKWIELQGTTKGMNVSRCKVRQTVQNNVRMYQDLGYEIVDQELVVRPTGSVKALTLEKSLRPQ